MSIMSYNGSALVAMKGKGCVAIASDTRYGVQFQTISTDFQKIFKMSDHLYLGLSGLATDIETVSNLARFRLNLYELREGRKMSPHAFMNLVSNILYSRRFGPYFVEPIIAGLDPRTGDPYVASCDLIGCPMVPEDFVVGGTCGDQLYGMCEALWEPDFEPDDLFESTAQALLNAQDRDAISGWGGVVHIILTKDYLNAPVSLCQQKCEAVATSIQHYIDKQPSLSFLDAVQILYKEKKIKLLRSLYGRGWTKKLDLQLCRLFFSRGWVAPRIALLLNLGPGAFRLLVRTSWNLYSAVNTAIPTVFSVLALIKR